MSKLFNQHIYGTPKNKEVMAKLIEASQNERQMLIALAKDKRDKVKYQKVKDSYQKLIDYLSVDNNWEIVLKSIIDKQSKFVKQGMEQKKSVTLKHIGVFRYNWRKHECQYLSIQAKDKTRFNRTWARYNKLRFIHQKANNLDKPKRVLTPEDIIEAEKILRSKQSMKLNANWQKIQFDL